MITTARHWEDDWGESTLWERVGDLFDANGKEGPHPSQLPPMAISGAWGGQVIVVLWAYQAVGCGVAFLEWFLTDPRVSRLHRLGAIDAVWQHMEAALMESGYGMVRCAFTDPRMARLATARCGLVDIGVPVHYSVKNLEESWQHSQH